VHDLAAAGHALVERGARLAGCFSHGRRCPNAANCAKTLASIASVFASLPSVTNFAEKLATLACNMFGINPTTLVWIEHYPADPCPICAGTGTATDGASCRACDGRGKRREAASYDLVSFKIEKIRGQMAVVIPRVATTEGSELA
jgi:hypothetical protein